MRVAFEVFVGAFKTLAPSDDQWWLMWVLVWNSERAEWMCGDMQTVGGVLAWWRCAMAQRAIMRRLFETVIYYYVDDTHVIDVEPGSCGAAEALQEVMSLLGWALDKKKRQPPSCCVRSIVGELSVQIDGVCWALDGAKRETWMGDIRRHLASGVMQPGEAAKLYGRLAFGGQRVFGRVGRAALRPEARQQRDRSTRIAGRLFPHWRGGRRCCHSAQYSF